MWGSIAKILDRRPEIFLNMKNAIFTRPILVSNICSFSRQFSFRSARNIFISSKTWWKNRSHCNSRALLLNYKTLIKTNMPKLCTVKTYLNEKYFLFFLKLSGVCKGNQWGLGIEMPQKKSTLYLRKWNTCKEFLRTVKELQRWCIIFKGTFKVLAKLWIPSKFLWKARYDVIRSFQGPEKECMNLKGSWMESICSQDLCKQHFVVQ